MTDFDPINGEAPSIGDEFIVPVNQASTRTSFFPDQVVAVTTNDGVELIMLRQEFVLRAQRGEVISVKDKEVQIEFSPHGFRTENFDIGHVKLAQAAALDLAITILAQSVQHYGMDADAIMQRLQASVVEAK